MKKIIFLLLIGGIPLLGGAGIPPALASTTDGTIDATNRYAWSENAGWIDFGSTAGNVHVIDSALTGYAWGENVGWISLNCSNTSSCATVDYKVANNSEGTLSGHAWSENAGWIQFDPSAGGVVIDSSGNFSGYAWGENVGWISLNCSNTSSCATVDYKISTDWRPLSSRSSGSGSTAGGSTGVPPAGGGTLPSFPPAPPFPPPPPAPPLTEEPPKPSIVERVRDVVSPLLPGFLKPKPKEKKPPSEPPPPPPKETPLSFRGRWNLIDLAPLREFVLAPLPREIQVLAQKFPRLEKTFEDVGVRKITDVGKLQSVPLRLPRLHEIAALPKAEVPVGVLAPPKGIPLTALAPQLKRELPSEVVFPRAAGEQLDLGVRLTVGEDGKPRQKIQTIAGKLLTLAIKVEQPVKSVKGYVVFKRKTPRSSSSAIPLEHFSASLLFATPVFAGPQEKPIETEEFVLIEFEYTDPDGDGIYTAEVLSPIVDGEYEIITVMNYADPSLGAREIRLTTVIDPEGYVFEKIGGKEARISAANVSLLRLNPATGKYELWPAKEYGQENPYVTDARGTYSFLVPEGKYALEVRAPGYSPYKGEPFAVEEGSGVHMNVELRSRWGFLGAMDWKTTLLVAVILLLLYNFYRDRLREKRTHTS